MAKNENTEINKHFNSEISPTRILQKVMLTALAMRFIIAVLFSHKNKFRRYVF